MKTENGMILKGIGGFYYVETLTQIYECKARGIFRKNMITPLAGDNVLISIGDDGAGMIEKVQPRNNFLMRPPVANLDQLIIIVSSCHPSPNPLIIDKMIAVAEDKKIEPVIVVSKTDLESGDWLLEIYKKAGIPFYEISSVTGNGIAQVKALLTGKITAFTGNSGVGKSTLLNCIDNRFALQTGEISTKLGRGRHTTRQVELLKLDDGGYVADTPGFSSLSIERYDLVKKENLQFCFREFAPFLNQCKFQSCSHICEKGCEVIQAVQNDIISQSRYDSYVSMYQEVKDLKEWKMK